MLLQRLRRDGVITGSVTLIGSAETAAKYLFHFPMETIMAVPVNLSVDIYMAVGSDDARRMELSGYERIAVAHAN